MKHRLFFLIFMFVFACGNLKAELLTDILSGKYKPEQLPQMQSMPDGERYAILEDSLILAYSYKTGMLTDTLFDIHNTQTTTLDSIQGFLLSPDERFLLVYNGKEQIYRRSFKANYYLYDRQNRYLAPLSEQMPVQSPVFSPNGKYIAFSRNYNLFIYKLDFSSEVQVTTGGGKGRILNGLPDWLYEEEFGTTCLYSFSSDSKQLAYVRLDEGEVNDFYWQDMLTEGLPENNNIRYARAGEKNSKAILLIYDVYYKATKHIPADVEYIPRIRWTNQPDELAVFALNRQQNKMDMWIVNTRTTVNKKFYTEENENGWVDYSNIDEWHFLSDNSYIAVTDSSGYRQAYLYSPLGQLKQQLTFGNQDVTRVYGFNEEENTLFYQVATTPLTRDLYSYNLKKQRLTCLTQDKGWHEAVFSKNLKYYLDNYCTAKSANIYTLYDFTGKRLRLLKDNNELDEMVKENNLSEKIFFNFATERGDTLNAWMLAPNDMDSSKQYPVVVMQYSGPCSQQVTDRFKVDWEHYLASQGYIVVCCDPRGTDGRGKEWREQTYMHLGTKEVEDQISLARHIQEKPFVKKDKIGVWGWSYGGFMTLMLLSAHNTPFCCGIAVAPVTDFRLYDSAYTERYMRTPQSNMDAYKAIDLTQKANQLNGKLLIVHGLADDNVHAQNTLKYIDALIQAGKQFEMQLYPDDNHFLRKRNNYQHLYQKKMEFFNKYLKN